MDRLTSPLRGFYVFPAVQTHSEVEVAPSYGLLDRIAIQLVSDGSANEVAAV